MSDTLRFFDTYALITKDDGQEIHVTADNGDLVFTTQFELEDNTVETVGTVVPIDRSDPDRDNRGVIYGMLNAVDCWVESEEDGTVEVSDKLSDYHKKLLQDVVLDWITTDLDDEGKNIDDYQESMDVLD